MRAALVRRSARASLQRRHAIALVVAVVALVACRRSHGPDVTRTDEPALEASKIDGSCGPGSSCAGVSCCDRRVVAGGTFMMGRDEAGNDKCPANVGCFAYEEPPKSVTVAPFALDTFETTVGRFRRFADAYAAWRDGGNPKATPAGSLGWDARWSEKLPGGRADLVRDVECDVAEPEAKHATWTATAGANEDKPINCVTWYEAVAFCIWDGGRLPTESEWEFAAAGGSEERTFPWGNDVPLDCSWASFSVIGGTAGCDERVSVVGAHPRGAGRWGHHDLAGNVFEWVFAEPWGDAQHTFTSVLKGGAFLDQATTLRAASRLYEPPSAHRAYAGFRCARTP